MVQKTPITVNFAKGLNQKIDPRQLPFTSFSALENMVFTKSGLLMKRNGFPNLSNAVAASGFSYAFNQIPSNISSGNTISSYLNELLLNDGMSLYSYAPDDTNWVYKGRAEACRITQQSIFQNQNNNIVQDSAINNTLGLSVFAWESWTNQPNLLGVENYVQVSVVDNTTGLTIVSTALSSTTSRPKCVSIGNFLYVLYYDSNDSKLHAQPVTQAGLGTAVAIISNIDTTNINYDALVFNSLLYVAYNGTSSSTVKVASFSSAMASVAAVSKAENASAAICLFSDTANNAWIAYNNGTSTKSFIMNSALVTTVLAPTAIETISNVHNITGIFDGTRGIIFYDKPGVLAVGQSTGFTTTGTSGSGFTQPAVGADIKINLNTTGFTEVGTVVFIPGGGYYYVEAEPIGGGIFIVNLGLQGNSAPGTTVAGTATIIYTTNGYLNSVVRYNTLTAAGSIGSPADFVRSVGLASRAFLQNGFAHVITVHDANLQPTYFVCSLYNVLAPTIAAHVLGKVSDSECGGLPYRSLLPSVNVQASGVYQCALLQRTFLVENTSAGVSHSFWFNGVISGVIDTTVTNLSRVQLGQTHLLASGTLLAYDGATEAEHNFHLFPENLTAVNTDDSSESLSAGVYSYICVYSWIDKWGQVNRSAPSLQVTLTCAAESFNTIVLPTLRVTEKTSVTLELYRTIANGTIFFRIDTLFLPFVGSAGYYPINNSTSTDTITILEGRADADITGNEQLYTTGEVENIAAVPPLAIFEYANRVILIPSDNPYSYWFSKQVIPGSPVEFSDLFVKNVGTVGGPLKGGARMDDKIILGKDAILYYVTGVGPAASGANDDFSDPIFITSDAGMVSYQLVTGPLGIFFKSKKGIYLLDRGLQASYIGAPVEDFNSFELVAAQLIPNTNQQRFMLSGGNTLMYDYFFQQWGEFSNPSGISDCIYQGQHTYLDASGNAYQETPNTYTDGASTPVLMSFMTANMNMASIVGYERIYDFIFLAQYLSPHEINLSITYDYLPTAQTGTITPTTSALEQWRVHTKRQLCQSFQVSLQEVYTGTPGAGFSMSGITYNLGIKKGMRPIPGASAAGLS